MSSKVDVELLYGVSGGGELSGASGQEIAKSLKKIIRGLEKSKIPTVKIFFDTKDLEDKLKVIKDKIAKTLGSAGNLKNIVTIQSRDSKGSSSQARSAKALTAEQKRQQTMYSNLKKSIEETLKSENKLYKSRTKNSELYINEIEKQKQATQELNDKMWRRYASLEKGSKGELAGYRDSLSSANQITAKEELTSLYSTYTKTTLKASDFITKLKEQGLRTTEAKQKLEELQLVMQKEINFTGDATTDLQNLRKDLNKLKQTYEETANYMAKSGELQRTPWQKLMAAITNKFQSMLSGLLIATAGRALMQVYTNVVNLDKALTNLQIATGKTRAETKELLNTYSQLAQQLGVTTLEVADAADTWLRQGYSVAETNELIKDTMMLAKLGQLDAAEAAKALTSAIKGYKAEVSDAMSIVDKFTAVDMEAAISAGDIATAMAETAASAEVAGVEMDKLIGYITAVGEVTQDSAESVGTFYKTLFARMGNISAGNFVDAESGEQLNDVEIVLNKLGISLRNETGDFREFSTVLDEVANNWDNFSNVQQHAIATAFAGTRQQEKFIVLMENYGTALEYAAVAADSAGTATAKYQDAYMSSIEAKVNSLTASWQEFSDNLLDSEIVKLFVDIIGAIVKVLNWVIKLGNGFVVKGAIIIASLVLINLAFKKLKATIIETFGAQAVQTLKGFITAMQSGAAKMWTSLKPLLNNGFTWFTLLLTLMTSVKSGWVKLVAAFAVGVAAIIVLSKAASTAIMSIPVIGWILALITAIITLTKTLSEMFEGKSYQEFKDEAIEARDAWLEAADAVDEINDKLEELQEQIDAINSKENLTLVDQEQLDALEQQKKILEQELKLKEDAAKDLEQDAANKAMKAMDKYANQNTRSGYKWWQWLVQPAWAIGELIADNTSDTQEEKLNKIFANWHSAAEDEKEYVTNYINELNELTSEFTYYTGDGLEDWQIKMNAYFDEYYSLLDRYSIANGDITGAWDSIFSRVKYKDAKETLKDLANDLNVTEDSLRDLYNNDAGVKQFIDYLQQIGLFSWDDANKIEGLVQQIRSLSEAAKVVSSQDYLAILSSMSKEYDALREAMEEVEEAGVLSYDTIQELMEEFPLLFEQLEKSGNLTKGADGYTLSGNTLLDYLQSVRDSYAETVKSAQEYYDNVLAAYNEGRVNESDLNSAAQSLENALNNQLEVEAVINTLEKTDLIEEFTKKLEAQSEELDKQLDKYKDIVDIRKELLETYQEELDYQKNLAQKQKTVADLETKLAIARMDTSASGRATVRELENELKDAQEELEEYTLEKAIEDLSAQLDAEYDEYEHFINDQVDVIKEAINEAAKMTAKEIREALKGGEPVGTHHTGGFVSGAKLNSHEEFAKLLDGELVVTPQQMSKFMNKTLPNIATRGGVVNYNSPLITIQCDSVDKESLPELKKIVDTAVKKVKEEIDKTIGRSGQTKNVDKFKI